ncbi:transposase [Tateyamaria omphalii]|uniref:Transposase zinc-ribbon domain-containing protein n=1 Tax=Tateyamaria omphalii TaxID=299262 RepID=A0A1P8MQH1_9RHOB|nr:transposase [Tateyamaria omphalii]APX10284.1 hypothetical protein BWR18_00140 [Tateyamaria omphalii]
MDDRAHWLSLSLRLPVEGVNEYFASEEACENRLHEIRWPNGPICPACSKKNFARIKARKPYSCRECKTQFSITSGTVLHGQRLGLKTYLCLAEQIVQSKTRGSLPTVHGTKERYGIAYATAFRIRNLVRKDLSLENGGLLGCCICVNELDFPQDIDPTSDDYLRWLLTVQQRRRWQMLGIE